MNVPIEWQSTYDVGIQVIDDQHQHMIEIINRLFTELETTLGSIDLRQYFEEAVAYAEYHFDTEEQYFSRYSSYPEKEAHLRAHREYRETIERFVSSSEDGRVAAKNLLDYLESWWIGHITGMDQTLRGLADKQS